MLSDNNYLRQKISFHKITVFWRLIFLALAWLILISIVHYYLNRDGRINGRVLQMGYMPVISNLACPLLDYAGKKDSEPAFNAVKFFSFAEMGEALRNNHIQVAFIIAPIALMLRQQGEDVKVVYVGNRNESTLVVDKKLNVEKFSDLAGKTVGVPMRYSGHYLSMLELIERHGLEGQIDVVELNPPDMASALVSKALSAYYVGEPFAAQTVKSGDAKVLFYVEQVWPGFICNLMMVHQDLIQNEPEVVQKLVNGAVRSGMWARTNPKKAAAIVSKYWNQPSDLVEYALICPENRIVYDRYIPREKELQHMADLMKRFGISNSNDINGLVDDRFAKNVSLQNITDIYSILE
ncbi:MAG: ABC transporter substrate-binding protein [Desulfobacterales bacterium]